METLESGPARIERIALGNSASEKTHESLFGDLTRIAAIGFLFAGIALYIEYGGGGQDAADARQWLQSYAHDPHLLHRLEGILGFIAGSGLLISLGIPRIWISAVAGAVYGALLGALWSMIAAIMGAAGVYLLGRTLLAGVVRRRAGERFSVWQKRLRQNAFWWVLYARLIPFMNATLTGLLFGSCRVRFSQYMAASAIGFIPLTAVFALFGSGGFKGSFFEVAIGFGLLVLTVLLRKWYVKSRPE